MQFHQSWIISIHDIHTDIDCEGYTTLVRPSNFNPRYPYRYRRDPIISDMPSLSISIHDIHTDIDNYGWVETPQRIISIHDIHTDIDRLPSCRTHDSSRFQSTISIQISTFKGKGDGKVC